MPDLLYTNNLISYSQICPKNATTFAYVHLSIRKTKCLMDSWKFLIIQKRKLAVKTLCGLKMDVKLFDIAIKADFLTTVIAFSGKF